MPNELPETQAEFAALINMVREAAAAYYDTSALLMTDAEYDRLIDTVEAVRAKRPEWDDEGVTGKVAAGQSRGGDVVHPSPLLSLAKVRTEDEVEQFLDDVSGLVLVEPKLDGMAVRAEYRQGRLVMVATRGDGYTGEDVTAQVQSIAGLPVELSSSVDLEVRGEVYMTDDDFEIANENRVASGKSAFVNPRNAVAGTLRKHDREYEAPMSFAAYEASGEGDGYVTRLQQVREFGITPAYGLVVGTELIPATPDAVRARIAEIGRQRSRLGFPIDGAVVKVDSTAVRERMGMSSHSPRWAVAFKYPADTAVTVLRDIELAIGRTGRLSLRAVMDPVFVGGATVTYATLHHPGFVQNADLRIGDTVYVYRSGDVIPRVTAPVLAQRPADAVPWKPPTMCPQCGETLLQTGLTWRCETPSCSTVGRIRYFASRDVMDVDGLDAAIAEALVESGLVQDIADLYDLTLEQLAALPIGVLTSGKPRLLGATVGAKLIAGIERSKQQPLNRVITSLGIRGVGRSMGRRLASRFGDLDALRSASPAELSQVEGVGEIKAEMLYSGIREMAQVIDRLVTAGVQVSSRPNTGPGNALPLAGKKVVVTGTVPGLTRTQAQEAVERLGGTSSSSVSRNTDLVVIGDGAGSKAAQAGKLGVPTMTAADFAKLL